MAKKKINLNDAPNRLEFAENNRVVRTIVVPSQIVMARFGGDSVAVIGADKIVYCYAPEGEPGEEGEDPDTATALYQPI